MRRRGGVVVPPVRRDVADMSALRINVPGQPVRFIDQGPACGRVLHTRGPVAPLGGMLVVSHTEKRPLTEAQKEANREQVRAYNQRHHAELMEKQRQKRAADKARRASCGKWMPLVKEGCARTPGHRDSCRSAAVMADEATRRSSGRGKREAARTVHR